MTYQVLARKWRPKNFTELVGQAHVVKTLTHALEKQRLHHAYLFTGTRGVGKTTLARIMAKSLNCEVGITATPCGVCSACSQIEGGHFVDLLELDAASNTGIDNMREVLDYAQYAPTSGRFKVYIIDEVHMLSKSAFNAMLKTLEEPPAHVKFILATTDPQKVPVTILSRCLQFNLRQIQPSVIADHLQHILKQEAVEFEPGALNLLGYAAHGSLRDALSLLDQAIAYGNGQVVEEATRTMLGAVDQRYLFNLLEGLARQDKTGLFNQIDEMASRSLSFELALQDLASLLHQVALAQVVPEAIADDLPERERILGLAGLFTPEETQLYYQISLNGRKDLNFAPDEYAGFSMTLLRMLAFAPETVTDVPVEGKKPQPQSIPPLEKKEADGVPTQRIEQPPAAPLAATPIQNKAFDGNWPELINQLQLSGMAKMLAQHCEFRQFDGHLLALCVPEAHKYLMEYRYQDKLKAALRAYFCHPIELKVSIGAITGETPAVLANRQQEAKQERAIGVIEQDPFVRELVEHFDATIIESSIKPI